MEREISATRLLGESGKVMRKQLRCFRLQWQSPGAEAKSRVYRQTRVLLGSRSENDCPIADDTVSRLHCEILASESGFLLRDLGSRNGTWLGERRVIELFLRPGDRLSLGQSEVRFELLDDETTIPLSERAHFGSLHGMSPSMRELFALLQRVAATDSTVLIQGESGTGKELVAESLHRESTRKNRPFVVFDCAAVAPQLLESELFGHEKGAFTGALSRRTGCAEEAEGGTLFLDEIGEMPLELQPKLLRLLEAREFRRVGSTKTLAADLRIVAATHRDLAKEVNRGAFREDLYYRLAVVTLHVPALRERREDIVLLVEHFVRQALRHDQAQSRQVLAQISPEHWRQLEHHSWPGNVRELRNVVERMLALGAEMATRAVASGAPGHAPASDIGREDERTSDLDKLDFERPLMEQKRAFVARFETIYLQEILRRHNGNISRAAEAAGVDRMYFKRLMRKYTL